MKSALARAFALAIPFLCAGPASAVTMTQTVVDGLKVYRYAWTDSQGRPRTLSLKIEGSGNPGHGGYAVAATYDYLSGGVWRRQTVKPSVAGDGFGYFVSHERERLFADGASATIAAKIFHVDDSPLGRGFAVSASRPATGPRKGIIRFSLTYSHYGTIAANGIDPETGNDRPPLGVSRALFKNYTLPVEISWYFQDGADFPRIRTQLRLDSVPGPDRVSFDLRGPYGKLDFDGGANAIARVRWGDSHQFATIPEPLTRNATWAWNAVNTGARFSSLIAAGFEMGLVEPRPFSQTALNDGYADGRGRASSTYFRGRGCPYEAQLIPCDYEWPYQSAQYELPYDNRNRATTSEKMAWGSSPYYGTSLASTYDGLVSRPFVGFPASKVISYDVCLVLGPTVSAGLTRTVALAGRGYRCADASSN